MARKERMYRLDVISPVKNVNRPSALLDSAAGVYVSFRAGEWAKLSQKATANGDKLVAQKVTTAPTKTSIGYKFAPCFTDTAYNSSAQAIHEMAYVDHMHEAWTDYYDTVSAPAEGNQLTVTNGKLYVASAGELVVAVCLAGPTARQDYSQGAPTINMIRYKTVDPYVYVS